MRSFFPRKPQDAAMDTPDPVPVPCSTNRSQVPPQQRPAKIVRPAKRLPSKIWWVGTLLVTHLVELGRGNGIWGNREAGGEESLARNPDLAGVIEQVHPPSGCALPVHAGEAGLQLAAVGVIDRERFIDVYSRPASRSEASS